jgi:pyridoxal phosphate enzyme (YggS family)
MSAAKLSNSFYSVTENISRLEQKYHRPKHSVMLLAVSKGQSVSSIQALYELGQRHFAQNYLQESLDKISSLQEKSIAWHYIGTVQTNKAKIIANNFDWIHTIQRPKEVQAICKHRSEEKLPIHACIQIKIDPIESKSGTTFEEVEKIIEVAKQYKNKILIRGLMGFPPPCADFIKQCDQYEIIKSKFSEFKQEYDFDTLSIGTSGDYEAAIKMGATIIRLGTILFKDEKGEENA